MLSHLLSCFSHFTLTVSFVFSLNNVNLHIMCEFGDLGDPQKTYLIFKANFFPLNYFRKFGQATACIHSAHPIPRLLIKSSISRTQSHFIWHLTPGCFLFFLRHSMKLRDLNVELCGQTQLKELHPDSWIQLQHSCTFTSFSLSLFLFNIFIFWRISQDTFRLWIFFSSLLWILNISRLCTYLLKKCLRPDGNGENGVTSHLQALDNETETPGFRPQ